jgi:hypothetical protein
VASVVLFVVITVIAPIPQQADQGCIDEDLFFTDATLL